MMLWKCKGETRKSPTDVSGEKKKKDRSEESRQPGETQAFLSCNGLWKRIRCLILLSEQTRRSSYTMPASKGHRQLSDKATPAMSQS